MNSAQERYAFIALLFLVVVVSVVAFWDDGDSSQPVQAATLDETVQVDPGAYSVDEGALGSRRDDAYRASEAPAGAGSLALAGLDEDVPEVDPVSTRGLVHADHARDPRSGLGADERGLGADERGLGADERGLGADDGYPADSYADGADLSLDDRRADGEGWDARGAAPLEPMRPSRGDDLAQGLSLQGVGDRPTRLSRDRGVAQRERAPETPASSTRSAAKPKPSAASNGATRSYVVKAGDALSTIASRECGSTSFVNEIVRLNGLSNPDKIFEGMKLQLPEGTEGAVVAAVPRVRSPKASTARADGRPVVTIQRGQLLGHLLEQRYGTSKRSMPIVVELNPGLNPDRVREGQTLVLPRLDEVEGAAPQSARSAASEEPRLAQSGTPSRNTDLASSGAASGAKRGATKRRGNYVR